ncbi:diacylglycerol/polyprenol kinase family protein [Leptotrichia trevisanii]
MEIVKMIVVLAAFILFFLLLNQLEKSEKLNSELIRKILHIGSGIGGLALPFIFEEKSSVIILGAIFLMLLISIRIVKHKITGFKKVLETKNRKTFGDIYFIMSILGLWIVSSEDKVMYALPLIILMFSDAFAALIGEFYSKYRFNTGFGTKSIEGSITFFLTTYFVCINFFLLFSDINSINIVLVSLLLSILTMILEVISWNGLDNLFVPLFVYLFLRLNLYLTAQELMYKFWVIMILFIIIILNRKKTTLTRVAQTASLFFLYIVMIIGGIKWLIPPLIMYLGYYHFTPKVRGQVKDSLRGLLTIAFTTAIWLAISIILDKNKMYFIYIFTFSLHFGIINLIRDNAGNVKRETFRMNFLMGSIGKSLAFFIINYLALSRILDFKMLIGIIIFIFGGIFTYETSMKIFYIIEKEKELSGETKVFIASGIVFICSMLLLGIGML